MNDLSNAVRVPPDQVLAELLACEQRAITPRLFESTVFVSKMGVGAWDVAQRMVRRNAEHQALLADLIFARGGQPGPREQDLHSADLHFQQLSRVLPRLVADHERLIRVYRSAQRHVSGDPVVAERVGKMLAAHEADLKSLKSLGAIESQPGASVQ